MQQQGEAYRDGLTARVRELGIEDHVVFFNQFVEQAMLLDFISMCDVYVTPYLNEAQMTSGTLAYSFGLGKAVVSTPYWHAKELLSDGSGILVPFGDAAALSAEIAGLLTNDVRRHAMRKRAYAESRSMTWPQTAERYLSVFAAAHAHGRIRQIGPDRADRLRAARRSPSRTCEIGHFLSLCDSTGMLQHAVHSIPDRSHGYCVDDNARALLFASLLAEFRRNAIARDGHGALCGLHPARMEPGRPPVPEFHELRPPMAGSVGLGRQSRPGRCGPWPNAPAGTPIRRAADGPRRCSRPRFPSVAEFSSPRAWAFALLGLDAYCGLVIGDPFPDHMRRLLADRLMALFLATQTEDWPWFEDVLAYDNARLPQALIQTGLATGTPSYVEVGVRSLRWLMSLQTTSSGHFRPVGTESFGAIRRKPEAFDQQPVEASAAISACLAAWRTDGGAEWPAGAMRAFGWFLGENDLQTTLVDPRLGRLFGWAPSGSRQPRTWVRNWRWRTFLVASRWGSSTALPPSIERNPLPNWHPAPQMARSHRERPQGAFLSHSRFLNRQNLYLRPDPARVVVRPFRPATEPRDLNPTDKTRANHIVEQGPSARCRCRPHDS